MPQVSKLSQQKKDTQRVNVFLDGKFAFGISLESALKNNLKVGKTTSTKTVEELIKKEYASALFDKSLKFLEFRPRSEKEVRDYLAKKISIKDSIKFREAAASPAIERIIEKLTKYKYLNDRQFATWLKNSRVKGRAKSKMAVKIELLQKGIEKDIIEKTLSNFPDEVELAKKSVSKKIMRWSQLDKISFKKKIYSYLLTKGFSYEVIRKVFAFLTQQR